MKTELLLTIRLTADDPRENLATEFEKFRRQVQQQIDGNALTLPSTTQVRWLLNGVEK